MRKSLCDTFTGILHGLIDAPLEGHYTPEVNITLTKTIENIFFFLDGLLGVRDLKMDLEMAKQVMELLSDIFNHI